MPSKRRITHPVLRIQTSIPDSCMEGLRDLPPIAKHHPNTTPPETVEKIVALAMTHPSRGPNYLESLLKADSIQVSFVIRNTEHPIVKVPITTYRHSVIRLQGTSYIEISKYKLLVVANTSVRCFYKHNREWRGCSL